MLLQIQCVKKIKFLKIYGIHLSQPGQFMYSFSIGNLPSKFCFFFLLMIFIAVILGMHSFFCFLSVAQSWGSFLYPFKALSFELILFCEET